MDVSPYGFLDALLCGCMAIWPYGVAIWLHSYMAAWLCGYMVIWFMARRLFCHMYMWTAMQAYVHMSTQPHIQKAIWPYCHYSHISMFPDAIYTYTNICIYLPLKPYIFIDIKSYSHITMYPYVHTSIWS